MSSGEGSIDGVTSNIQKKEGSIQPRSNEDKGDISKRTINTSSHVQRIAVSTPALREKLITLRLFRTKVLQLLSWAMKCQTRKPYLRKISIIVSITS